jgi:dolichol-phosphate mannosyltransferase
MTTLLEHVSDASNAPTGRARDYSRPLISVVVPVFNEEGCLPALLERLTSVLGAMTPDYEILLVDDGSRDRSAEILRRWAARESRIGFHRFSRNFGHEAATTCGLLAARGQTVVLIDADLQDPPELIPALLAEWRAGFDVVYAQRSARDGETAFTRVTSHLFYRFLKRVSRVEIPLDTGDFRLMDRVVVDAFAKLPERCRFVRGMLSWVGFRQTAVRYDRDARLAGETKYNFIKRLALAFDALCALSDAPLRWVSVLGATALLLSGGILLGVCADAVLTGTLSTMGLVSAALAMMSGVQLVSLGVVAEYVGRIYRESQGRPVYVVAEEQLPLSELDAEEEVPAYSQAG